MTHPVSEGCRNTGARQQRSTAKNGWRGRLRDETPQADADATLNRSMTTFFLNRFATGMLLRIHNVEIASQ